MANRIQKLEQVEAICSNSQRAVPYDHKGRTIWCPECGRKLTVKTVTHRYGDYTMRYQRYPHHLDSQRGLMF